MLLREGESWIQVPSKVAFLFTVCLRFKPCLGAIYKLIMCVQLGIVLLQRTVNTPPYTSVLPLHEYYTLAGLTTYVYMYVHVHVYRCTGN